ncbi:hypothetical protein GCM10023085_46550 [Actinomadura viridis]
MGGFLVVTGALVLCGWFWEDIGVEPRGRGGVISSRVGGFVPENALDEAALNAGERG